MLDVEGYQTFVFLPFYKLFSFEIFCDYRGVKTFGQSCTLSTLRGEEFVLTSVNSVAIAELIVMFLEGLKKRSLYAVAIQDKKLQGNLHILYLLCVVVQQKKIYSMERKKFKCILCCKT